MSIAFIIGTRAELIKTFPLMKELQKRKIPYFFIHTGQHNLTDLCEDFGVKKPDIVLTKEPKTTTKFYANTNKAMFWGMSLILKIKKILNQLSEKESLKFVLYHGDTMSTACAAVASSSFLNPKKKWKNIHLEAGLRSGSFKEPFPEEISRRIADKFSDILFAVSDLAEKNLKKERHKGNIIKVGNTIVDAANIAYKIALKKKIKKLGNNYALISIHRHENIKNKERLKRIVHILSELPLESFWPLYDNTKKQLIKFGLYKKLLKNKNIKIISPMSYVEFIFHLANSNLLITDGGSIQEESLVFKKPCILLRKKTERQEGLKTGINFLTKLDIDYGKSLIRKIEKGEIKVKKFKNPYGNKGLSKKILNILK